MDVNQRPVSYEVLLCLSRWIRAVPRIASVGMRYGGLNDLSWVALLRLRTYRRLSCVP